MPKHTSLCYLESEGRYLMLHRIKKEHDENAGKWIGIGGKFEAGESPFDCARREIYEETGLICDALSYRGIVTFVSDEYGTEYMHLFHSGAYRGEMKTDCPEGVLEYIKKEDLLALPLWEGDKIFLRLLDTDCPFFSLKLCYSGERLVDYELNFCDGEPHPEYGIAQKM